MVEIPSEQALLASLATKYPVKEPRVDSSKVHWTPLVDSAHIRDKFFIRNKVSLKCFSEQMFMLMCLRSSGTYVYVYSDAVPRYPVSVLRYRVQSCGESWGQPSLVLKPTLENIDIPRRRLWARRTYARDTRQKNIFVGNTVILKICMHRRMFRRTAACNRRVPRYDVWG